LGPATLIALLESENIAASGSHVLLYPERFFIERA
jgi:hypothetical protein